MEDVGLVASHTSARSRPPSLDLSKVDDSPEDGDESDHNHDNNINDDDEEKTGGEDIEEEDVNGTVGMDIDY